MMPQNTYTFESLDLWMLLLCKKNILADVKKLRFLRWRGYPHLSEWTLSASAMSLYDRSRGRFDLQRRRCQEDRRERDLKTPSLE